MGSIHEFEQLLCDYLTGTIGGHAVAGEGAAIYRSALIKRLQRPVSLAHAVLSELPRPPLSDDEIEELRVAVSGIRLAQPLTWTVWHHPHLAYVALLPAIRQQYSTATAEWFAAGCAGYACRLEVGGLALAEGVAILGEWIEFVRRLIRATGRRDLVSRPARTQITPASLGPLEAVGAAGIMESGPAHPRVEVCGEPPSAPPGEGAGAGAGAGAAAPNPRRASGIMYADEVASELGLAVWPARTTPCSASSAGATFAPGKSMGA